MLAQLGVVAALFDTAAAATFFVLWTLVWASSVWLRFGVDQVIPRKAAHARITGDLAALAGTRGVVLRTAPVLAVALPLLVAITLGATAAGRILLVAGLCFAAAAAWGAIVLLAALLRGFDAVGRSGAVQGVLPSAALLAASAIAPQISDGWIGLLAASTVALWVALVAAVAVTARAIGRPAIGAMLFARGPADAEQLPAGLLTVLSEVGLALPLLLGLSGRVCRTPSSPRCTPPAASPACSRGPPAPSPRWRPRAWRWRSPGAPPSGRCCAARRSRRRRRRCRSPRSASSSRRSFWAR